MLKGHVFVESDIPPALRRKMSPEQRAAWVAAQTERYSIVAHDGDRPLVAGEIDQRALNRLSSKARRLAGAMLKLDRATRREILGAFDADGNLIRPFAPA
jgi:hypothetical protein